MRRRLPFVLLVGIALQALGGIALIAWWTRDEPSAAPAASAAATEGGAPAALPPVALALASTDPTARAEPPGAAAQPAATGRPSRAVGAPRGAAASPRRGQVSFRQEMKAGLGALERRVAGCAPPGTWFTLDLETVDGGVRIAGAKAGDPDAADDASVGCARAVLVGQTIAAPSAQPGRRWQMQLAPAVTP